MPQKLNKCAKQLSAKLEICNDSDTFTLVAFLPMIRRIAQDDTITSLTSTDEVTTQLLTANKFNLTYNPNRIINAVYR